MVRRISIFGATGSIGQSTLDVLRALGGREAFDVVALTGASNITALAAAAREFGADIAVTADEARLDELRAALAGSGVEAAAGAKALEEAAGRDADWVMAAIVGAAGLRPTLAAIRQGATIALANKECLVSAGGLFLAEAKAHNARIIPTDSEHSAIFQCLDNNAGRDPARYILTASGGPFRDWPREKMAGATPEMAAAHPNWSMGLKISIDSASMFNKALEMIEARWLFGATAENLDVVIHPQSIVHSAVCYADGSVLAHLGEPDMRTAIGYALSWPERRELPVKPLDLVSLSRLDFFAPDEERFPALGLARAAMAESELAGAALNAAKEAALEAFIDRRVGFLDMARIVGSVMGALETGSPARDIYDVLQMDQEARILAQKFMPSSAA